MYNAITRRPSAKGGGRRDFHLRPPPKPGDTRGERPATSRGRCFPFPVEARRCQRQGRGGGGLLGVFQP